VKANDLAGALGVFYYENLPALPGFFVALKVARSFVL